MQRPEFLKFWELKLGDLLQITAARFPMGAGYYHEWLHARLGSNAAWDAMVRELLTAVGSPTRRGGGAANYATDGPDPQTRAELTAQRFLGLRLHCAQCHDHPFDVWTQDDYYGLAAFFAKVKYTGTLMPTCGSQPLPLEVLFDPDGTVTHLRTKQPVPPRLLTGETVTLDRDADPRKALADWITRPDNPFFARAMANWVWAQFFGKGLVEPADDLSAGNPPVHLEVLDALARHFVAHKYDLRELIRTVAISHAYELASEPIAGNEHDTKFFSHHLPRPLTAQQMADALAQATDVPNHFANRPRGARALDVFDPATASAMLDTFGRCSRRSGCAAVANPPLSLRQALMLMGGDVIDAKVASLNGYLSHLLEYGTEPSDVIEHIYLRTLCRPPTSEERAHWTAELASAPVLREAAEDSVLGAAQFAGVCVQSLVSYEGFGMVNVQYVLSAYIESALDRADYEKLEDGAYAGSIPVCPGVLAFANSLRDCERELRSVLEDWLLLGLKLGHQLPVVGEIDLNKDTTHAEVESV